MKVFCAWCEREGRQALLYEVEPREEEASFSHGICEAHQQRLLVQLHQLRKKDSIRQIPRRLSLPHARGNASPITVMYL